jgi:enamine deaminase RidA (YjgF/YER057c/UK114 family)
MRTLCTTVFALLLSCGLAFGQADQVEYVGSEGSSIASAVKIPADHTLFWTSGTVPPTVDTTAAEGSKARYGDMETQATGALQRVADKLEAQGLSMDDVVFLKVYLVPNEDGSVNFDGWSAAYAKFFGTEETPTTPARSTMAVHQLFLPGWRVEVEAVAAMPPK